MASRLAKLRFIADSIDATYRGVTPMEIIRIAQIRREFEPYLHSDPPGALVAKLGPIAEQLIADTPNGEELAAMYEDR